MGEATLNMDGLLSRLSALFNNQMFSDVQFSFDDEEQILKLYGHKLILALRSDYFASMFYGKKETSYKINIPASTKESFYLLLRFLYTDDIQFHSAKEAEDILKLAQQYSVKELVSKCFEYLLKERITINNIFQRYECALSHNIEKLLKDCRTFVCRYTEAVFESHDFYDVSAAVVVDIAKQNDLMLPSEILLIHAIITWCKVECKRNKVPSDDKHLRECISPFMKHIRFLTLTQEEFDSFVKYNILDGYETYTLTRKILQPDSDVTIPENICNLKNKRGTSISNFASVESSKSSKFYYTPPHFNHTPLHHAAESAEQLKNVTASAVFENPSNINKFEPKRSTQKIVPNKKKSPELNKFSYQVRNVTRFSENSATKFQSSPNINIGNPQDFDYSSPVSSYDLRTFSFPLSETPPSFRESFHRDIKCSATFKMKSGNIELFGFELNVRNKGAAPEELEVDVDVRGFSNTFSKIYKKKLKNNVFIVKFSDPVTLRENEEGEIDISIDNLLLNRCSVCSFYNKKCELNNGTKFMCEMFLSSNFKCVDNDIFFLISKLLYKPSGGF